MWPFTKKTDEKRTARSRPAVRGRRMFEAAKTNNLTGDWGTTPLSADRIVEKHHKILVARSREQAANSDHGRSFIRMCRQNIVGSKGVLLQAQSRDMDGRLDRKANDAIEAAWKQWGHKKICDIAGKKSWRAIQASCVATAAKDGEFMLLVIRGRDAGEWGIALQEVDPQRCPVELNEERLSGGRFIRHGIEFNRYGRPMAYYFTGSESDSDYRFGSIRCKRISADQVIHGFVSDMVSQRRGLPWMATALYRMKMLTGFEDAALVNSRVSAAKGGFITWREGYEPPGYEDQEHEEVFVDVEPGQWQELPPGAEATANNPNYPNGEFEKFTKSMLRSIASGLGVAYNNLANDLEGVNFSSIRQGKLDERDNWKDMQEWLVEDLVAPVFEAWLKVALLKGKITVSGKPLKASRIEKYSEVSWQPRRWEWIDPRSDMAAAESSVKNLFSSPSQIIRDQGRDPQSVWREYAADIDEMKKAGIPEGLIPYFLGNKEESQQDDDNDDENV